MNNDPKKLPPCNEPVTNPTLTIFFYQITHPQGNYLMKSCGMRPSRSSTRGTAGATSLSSSPNTSSGNWKWHKTHKSILRQSTRCVFGKGRVHFLLPSASSEAVPKRPPLTETIWGKPCQKQDTLGQTGLGAWDWLLFGGPTPPPSVQSSH